MAIRGNVAESYRVVGVPFQFPAGEYPGGIAIKKQGCQHDRIIGVWAATGIGFLERRKVELVDNLNDKPGKVSFRQPLLNGRGEKVYGLSVAIDKIDFHLIQLHRLFTWKMNDYSILQVIIHGKSRITFNNVLGKSDRLLGRLFQSEQCDTLGWIWGTFYRKPG